MCHCCGKSQKHFASKKNFFEHLKSANHSEKNYNCDQSEKTFQYNKGLLCLEEKLFQCESCDQVFGREDNLKRHIKQKHETDIGGESCRKFVKDINSDIQGENLLKGINHINSYNLD